MWTKRCLKDVVDYVGMDTSNVMKRVLISKYVYLLQDVYGVDIGYKFEMGDMGTVSIKLNKDLIKLEKGDKGNITGEVRENIDEILGMCTIKKDILERIDFYDLITNIRVIIVENPEMRKHEVQKIILRERLKYNKDSFNIGWLFMINNKLLDRVGGNCDEI